MSFKESLTFSTAALFLEIYQVFCHLWAGTGSFPVVLRQAELSSVSPTAAGEAQIRRAGLKAVIIHPKSS